VSDPPLSPHDHDGTEGFLRPNDLARLTEFIYRRTGMFFNESKRYFIDRRVAERMVETRSNRFSIYFAHLRADDGEVEQLINSVTVNETYFYREHHQFETMHRSLLPEIVERRRPGDLVRIWSLPCSTGEEAYSIAIWLLENWRLVDAYNVEIVGSDIDSRALAEAQEGLYGARSLGRLSEHLRKEYFEPAGDGFRLIQDLRESVTFTNVNLIEAMSMAGQGRFDIIFCRNVLIYFDEASRRIAARHLFDSLNPGGFICLGHSESMTRISSRFLTRRFPDAVVHQRPLT
jgi:chemotaxis protein methyltransferase CheR